MQSHDEERDIYGAVYVQGKKYFLLEPEPTRKKEWWMIGMNKWLVAYSETDIAKRVEIVDAEDGYEYVSVYEASFLVVGTDAIIDLLPVPLTKKVIRFYVTDDEEA